MARTMSRAKGRKMKTPFGKITLRREVN